MKTTRLLCLLLSLLALCLPARADSIDDYIADRPAFKRSVERLAPFNTTPLQTVLNGVNYQAPRVILDHDFYVDLGDAMGLKHALALNDRGLLNIIAVGNTLTNEYTTASVAAFLNYYGYGKVPLGRAYTNTHNPTQVTVTNVAKWATYPGVSPYNSNYPSAVAVYRKALVEAPDGSVVFLAEGDLQNLRDLWDSPADSIYPKTGSNLCELKLKYIFISAGQTNQAGASIEYNLNQNLWSAGVITNLTVPTVWMWGDTTTNALAAASWINVGQNLLNTQIHPFDSPCYVAASNYNAINSVFVRPAWDGYSKTYIAAARNITDGNVWHDGTALFTVVGPGRPNFIGAAKMNWSNSIPNLPTNHYYLVENGIAAIATNFINGFIDAAPEVGKIPNVPGPGSTAVVSYGSSISASSGLYFPAAGSLGLVGNGTEIMRLGIGNAYFPSTANLAWGAGALGGGVDSGIGRNGVGEMVVFDGATLALQRDFAARKVSTTNIVISTTNYVAAQFAPVAGKIVFAMSNQVLYGISVTKTSPVVDLR